jgi:hypothetical protein
MNEVFSMKKLPHILFFGFILILLGSCASTEPVVDAGKGVDLDTAIEETAAYFAEALPADTYLAIVGIDAETTKLSRYVAEELQGSLQRTGKFRFVERENLGRIMDEVNFQASGLVDDDSVQGMGHLSGAETIIYGSVTSLGNDYRMTVYASAVRSGELLQQTKTAKLPPQFAADPAGANSTDAAIDRAVYEMGRGITGRKTVGMGRISLYGTQSVTDLSNYLLDRITESALQRTTKYRIAGKTNNAAEAVVEGSFTPLDGGAEVTLRLVSNTDKTVLGSSRFAISGEELDRRHLSVYPPEGDGYVTPAESERLQKVIEQYDGKNNAFKLDIEIDHPTGIYYDQEYLAFSIYSEQDCFVRISQVDIHGRMQVIYPLSEDEPHFIEAGTNWAVPADIVFQVTLPRGIEYILVAAFDNPFAIEQPKSPQRITAVTAGEGFKARAMIRQQGSAKVAGSTQNDIDCVATAQCSYTILPKP